MSRKRRGLFFGAGELCLTGTMVDGERNLYQGYALQAVDKKGRLAIPNRLRDTLTANSGERTLMIGDEQGMPCMVAYDCAWSKLMKARLETDYNRVLDRGEDISRARDALMRFANVDEVQFDEAGRFILPSYVIGDLELTDYAFFAGAGDVFHIWNPRKLLTDSQVPEGTRKRCAFVMQEKGVAV